MNLKFLWLGVLLLVARGLCALGQAPSPASRDELINHARQHAADRLVTKLKKAWPTGAKIESLFKDSGLAADLENFVASRSRAWARTAEYSDGAVEVCLTVPSAEVGLFYRDRAAVLAEPLRGFCATWARQLTSPGTPFIEACGTATLAALSWRLHPPDPGVWSTLDPPLVAQAEKAARQNAVQNLWKQIAALQVEEGEFVNAFLAGEGVAEEVGRVLGRSIDRGLLQTRFLGNGTCQYDLYLDLADLKEALDTVAARRRLPGGSPFLNVNLERLKASNGGRRNLVSTGGGRIAAASGAAAPDWAGVTLTVTGEAPVPAEAESQEAAWARARQDARMKASGKLRDQILALKMPSGRTLGELSKDPVRANSLENCITVDSDFGRIVRRQDNVFEAELKIPLARVWDLVKDWE